MSYLSPRPLHLSPSAYLEALRAAERASNPWDRVEAAATVVALRDGTRARGYLGFGARHEITPIPCDGE